MAIHIIKRDGTLEDFDANKISRVVQAAGLDAVQADRLAQEISGQLTNSGDQTISSLTIRDLVIKKLHHLNENAANLFTWYEKTKDDLSTSN